MIRLTALLLFASGSAVVGLPDVSPTTLRLDLARSATGLRGETYTVNLLQVTQQRDGTNLAWVRITKNDFEHGPLTMDLGLKVGESFGISTKLDLKVRGRIRGKLLELLEGENPIEFDPQATLISMRQYTDWPIRWCQLVPLPGDLGCMGFSHRRMPVPVNEIVIEEKGGTRITLQALGPGSKMPPDGHCSVHGGGIRARLLTEAERNLVRATNQLSEADENWKSQNPKVRKRAQESYSKLLKEYSEEAVVLNNRERIKSRAEAEIED